MSTDFTTSAAARIREFPGETPLQVMARQGAHQPTADDRHRALPVLHTFPFAWYWAAYSDDLAPGEVRPVRYLARDLVLWRDEEGTAHVMDAYCPHLGANLALGRAGRRLPPGLPVPLVGMGRRRSQRPHPLQRPH